MRRLTANCLGTVGCRRYMMMHPGSQTKPLPEIFGK